MKRRARSKSLPPKSWSMLAYIAGDNDLSDNGIEDITEMCETGASRKVHAAVQIDTVGEHTGSVRYEISEPDVTGESHRVVISRLPESDTGNPEVLYRFLKWGLKRYPATNTLAVVWNHGAGFRTRRRDIAFDDYGTSLDMTELQAALNRSGLKGDRKLAILGFDACLMNMLEIAYQLRDQTRFLVGSQQTEPADGWPYDLVLANLDAAPAPQDAARSIVRSYMRSYREVGDSNITQSAIRTDRSPAAVRAWSLLGDALAAALPADLPAVQAARARVQSYDFSDYVDAVHLASLFAGETTSDRVRSRAQAFARSVKRCVIFTDCEGAAVRDSNGLTIWFPASRPLYLDFRSKYTAMDFYSVAPGWVNFLDRYFA